MTPSTRRGVKEGLEFGLIAGLIFALAEIVAAALMGDPPLSALRLFASVLLGHAALETAALGRVVLVGAIAHLLLSAVFGVVYGLFAAVLAPDMQTNWRKQAWIGLAFGASVWLVNFQIFAGILYPWFQKTPQLLQVSLHAAFFGLPLALMYVAAERRTRPVQRASTLAH
ncbi:MAG TPA: hypothetical protein VNW92_01890 [Polyangiaceae bacterium]|jgi:hypothetical protein|nr:hypothetical protein [Polyangiaceae bacterium]